MARDSSGFVWDTVVMTNSDHPHYIKTLYENVGNVHLIQNNEHNIPKDGVAQKCVCTGEVDRLVDIYVNNFPDPFRCSEDTMILMKDGAYRKAKDLNLDDDLMRFINDTRVSRVETVDLEEPVEIYNFSGAKPFNNFLIALREYNGFLFAGSLID